MDYQRWIGALAERRMGATGVRIRSVHLGVSNRVYIVTVGKEKAVFKFPMKRKKQKVLAERWASEVWRSLGLPVPRILFCGSSYIAEEYISGAELGEVRLSGRQMNNVMLQLGRYARKMHTERTRGYGYFKADGVGEKKSWQQFMDPFFWRNVKEIKKHSAISKDILARAIDFYTENAAVLAFHMPILLHADLAPDNILIKNGRISGLVDASGAMSGDPMFDVAIVNQNNFGSPAMKYFLRGYGGIDEHRVDFYTVYQAVWLASFAWKVKKRPYKELAERIIKHYT